MKNRTTMLMILDGYGINESAYGNAVKAAKKPNIDKIMAEYPDTQLEASGLAVGLPEGQMGNSEVGHLNIGAGRIIYQELTKITKHIEEGTFFTNPVLTEAVNRAKKNDKALHIMGLLSDGGVHSHIKHLAAVIKLAADKGLDKVYIHAFLDGRDVPPSCAKEYFEELDKITRECGVGKVATVSGRYYAMDRDNRWERVVLAYDALTLGEGNHAKDAFEAVDTAYDRGETDEFVLPTVIDEAFSPISSGDSVIMYNFRPDRARQITRTLVDKDFTGFERKSFPEDIYYVCMTQYDAEMPNVHVAYPPESYKNTLGEYIASLGMNQLRIAETEKYAHVTFFFNGGVEEPNKNEDRVLVNSPKVATYDLQPEMSAFEVTDKVIEAIDSEKYDMIILNFANSDMVGHTGNFDAVVTAIEALDKCVGRIAEKMLEKDGQILLTADHGNADVMLDENGNVVTSHSTNPVPFVHIAREPKEFTGPGKLSDIAPTMLTLMGLPVPAEMSGNVLVK